MEEPKELNWWIKATQLVRATLKPHIEEYNSAHTKKLSGTIHVSVAKALKSSNKLSATLGPQEADILKAYKTLLNSSEPEEVLEASDEDKLKHLLTRLFDGETTEIVIRRKRVRRGCCW
jgi:hypothetical protein